MKIDKNVNSYIKDNLIKHHNVCCSISYLPCIDEIEDNFYFATVYIGLMDMEVLNTRSDYFFKEDIELRLRQYL